MFMNPKTIVVLVYDIVFGFICLSPFFVMMAMMIAHRFGK